jgi:hypothetical protein
MTKMNWNRVTPMPAWRADLIRTPRKDRKIVPDPKCRWAKINGTWAIRGPASVLKPGAMVKVWNATRKDYTEVKVKSVMGNAVSGNVIAFPAARY